MAALMLLVECRANVVLNDLNLCACQSAVGVCACAAQPTLRTSGVAAAATCATSQGARRQVPGGRVTRAPRARAEPRHRLHAEPLALPVDSPA